MDASETDEIDDEADGGNAMRLEVLLLLRFLLFLFSPLNPPRDVAR